LGLYAHSAFYSSGDPDLLRWQTIPLTLNVKDATTLVLRISKWNQSKIRAGDGSQLINSINAPGTQKKIGEWGRQWQLKFNTILGDDDDDDDDVCAQL